MCKNEKINLLLKHKWFEVIVYNIEASLLFKKEGWLKNYCNPKDIYHYLLFIEVIEATIEYVVIFNLTSKIHIIKTHNKIAHLSIFL